MAVIALDLGGTKLAGAIVDSRGRILRRVVEPLEGRTGRRVGRLVCQQADELLRHASNRRLKIRALGVAVPGISHIRTGRVWAPNIPGWKSYPLEHELRAGRGTRGVPIAIESDRACY